MLDALDVDIVALRDRFPANEPDIEIFNALAGSNYVFVSQDRRQLTRVIEAEALRASGISAMYFGPFWSDLGFWNQAAYLLRFWPDWDTTLRTLTPGTIVEARQRGRLMTMN
jgi:hypothetical protein